jgi:subtilisin-like proprotein convertase family protein
MKKFTLGIILSVILVLTGTMSAQISTFPYAESFEGGPGGWVTSGTNNTWALGTPAKVVIVGASDGANAWVTSLAGLYSANQQSVVASPVFDFSAATGDPTIKMDVWWESEFSWDGAVLQTSVNGGATWVNVGAFGDPMNWYTDNTINGAPGGSMQGWTGRNGSGSPGWVEAEHLLDGMAGQSAVTLRVAFGSDSSVQDDGFAFDNVRITLPPPPPISTFPYQETFESGPGNWVASGTNSSWQLGTPANSVIIGAAEGANAWITNLTGSYNNSENSRVQSPVFDFSALPSDPTLTMSIWWNSEFSWDGSNLQASTNGGATWTNVGTFGDPNNWYNDNTINGNPGGSPIGWTGRVSSGNGSGGWVEAEHALDGLAGLPAVSLRVTFGSDSSVSDNGFAFDNVRIGIGAPPIISCPADQMLNTNPGVCTAVATWADALALDPEDGPIPTTQTMGPASGTMFPVGVTTIEYSATDSDGNTVTCQFTITVTDNEAPIAICQDITVELDAAGNYTMSPNEIDNGSSDNCGIVTYEFGSTPGAPGSLSTLYATNNGGSNGGAVYFDVTIGPNDIDVTGFDLNTNETGAFTVDVYTIVGTSVGNETNMGLWTLAGTGSGTAAPVDTPSVATLGSSFTLSAGTTYGIALAFDATHGHSYTNGTGGNQNFSNADLAMALGQASNVPFTPGIFSPRVFNGGISYTVGGGPVFGGTFDCSNVGTNSVILTVTDANGNASSCTSTVTVEDNIAPVIACTGQPATVVDTTSDSPALAIVDNTTVSTMMSVTDDFVITDLDVDLDITHTWVGDLQITLESPAGTQVLIFDGSADGCSGDNINVVFDDESPNALACMTGADAFPLADYMPSNALAAFDGESTLGDWIISIEDTAGGDQGTLNTWTLNYSHDVTGSPYDVILDASGNATINTSDLLMGITEACGWTATTGGAPLPATLATTLAGGNGNFGNMFDINALEDVTIDSFDVHGEDGVTFDVEVWAKSGTWVGSENTPGDWTLIGTAPGVVSNGSGVVTPLGLSLGYVMNAGETHAFYVTPIDPPSGGFQYTNGTTVGAVFASDANIEFLEGAGNAYPFGTTFQPRIFNGNIQYSAGGGPSTTIDFDCSNLGLNTVDITVTDDSGNVATCTATVNVLDETAPVITCVGPTTPIFTGTASDSPGTVIVDNTTVSTTIEVTDDVTMTDLNVDMNITHTWVGDLQITLESPAGTSVLIFDGGADGCSGDNINDLYDDESPNALVCMGASGDAFPLADYMPSNALSAFDGESTLGTWTLSVQDTAGGDSGTIDSWSLIYTYEGAPLPAYPIYLDENGEYTVDPLELIATVDEACGISTSAADITDFFCSDVGTGIILVTVFVSDASGNIASCVAEVEVFDNLPPVVECPADITVDPGPGNLFYEVPDYFATGEATATDNCTDPVTILSQSPAAGTLLPDGVYPVTMTAEDEWGNVGTCTFTLTIESVLGVDENALDVAIIMYPNPAQNQVTISNSSNIQLEKAAIYDLNGKLISQTNLSNMVGEKVIDVSELAAGVYVVQISSDNASAIKRLIKE